MDYPGSYISRITRPSNFSFPVSVENVPENDRIKKIKFSVFPNTKTGVLVGIPISAR